MDMVRQIGGTRMAAPPSGATNQTNLNILQATERYRACANSAKKSASRRRPKSGGTRARSTAWAKRRWSPSKAAIRACILADVYHLHKGGSGFGGLKLLNGSSLQVFHMNDYPALPGRADITDAHRVYPGDGVAPLVDMLRDLRRIGFRGVLSLELFNREYWQQDAFTVARTGLEKTCAVVAASMNG